MYKAYIKIRTAEYCLIFRRANTIDETHLPFSSSKLQWQQMSGERRICFEAAAAFHRVPRWTNVVGQSSLFAWIATPTFSSEGEAGERIRRLELTLRPPRLLPQVDDIKITPKIPPIGELTASKWSLVSVLEITKRSDKFGVAIA